MEHKLVELNAGDISVVGKPLHTEYKNILNEYVKNDTRFLKREAARSAGSYFLHDPKKNRIITSPGYVGGYLTEDFACTLLRPILDKKDSKSVQFHPALRRFLKKSYTSFWPYQSIFQSIKRLPPGSVINYKGDISYNPYLRYSEGNFNDAIEGAVEPLESVEQVTLMYSGGVDSTALYAALQSINTDVSVVSVDIGPNANSVERAVRIGELIGVDVEPVSYGWPPKNNRVINGVIQQMSHDIVDPFNPHHAFIPRSEDIVISGQNFDSVLTGNMGRPQLSILDHLRATKKITDVFKHVIPNVQYTNKYQRSTLFQIILSRLISRYNSNWRGVSGKPAYLTGILSSGFPNVIHDSNSTRSEQIASHLMDNQNKQLSYLTDILKHHQYQHNSNKLIGTQDAKGTSVYLPAMWGPFISRNIGRSRPLREAYRPKPQVYEYVKNKLGVQYENISYRSLESYKKERKESDQYQSKMSPNIIINEMDRINPEKLISSTPNNMVDLMENKIDKVMQTKNQRSISREVYSDFFKVLNLSCLLSQKD